MRGGGGPLVCLSPKKRGVKGREVDGPGFLDTVSCSFWGDRHACNARSCLFALFASCHTINTVLGCLLSACGHRYTVVLAAGPEPGIAPRVVPPPPPHTHSTRRA